MRIYSSKNKTTNPQDPAKNCGKIGEIRKQIWQVTAKTDSNGIETKFEDHRPVSRVEE